MIIATFNCNNIINRCVINTRMNSIRSLSFLRIKETLPFLFSRKARTPPYNHLCQVDDPVLRTKGAAVDPKVIQTDKFQKLLEHLRIIMRKHDLVGIAAPQVGVSLQLFAIQVTERQCETHVSYNQESLAMEVVPLTYFINPTMEIVNSEEVTCFEFCGSIKNCAAEVPRAKEVRIKALDRFGNAFTWSAKGWTARIAQHEFDHIHGILYTDKMEPSTFERITRSKYFRW